MSLELEMALTSIARSRERARDQQEMIADCEGKNWIIAACNMVRGTPWEMRAMMELRRLSGERLDDQNFADTMTITLASRRAEKGVEWGIARREMRIQRKRSTRRSHDDEMRSLGLVKVRGAVSGKVYWE